MRTLTCCLALSLLACSGDSEPGASNATIGNDVPDVGTTDGVDIDDPDTGEDPDTGGCAADQCAIGGACYDNGQGHAEDPCRACLVVVSVGTWSATANACDDLDPCTADDVCEAGDCSGTAVVCDDGNLCTVDQCDPDSGDCVSSNAVGVACDDGDFCTMGDVCEAGACSSGKGVPPCADDNPCTEDTCDSALGCVAAPTSGAICDDGDSCTGEDVCTDGLCIGAPTACDDFDLCTVDACVSGVGCVYTGVGDQCGDGNLCTDDSCDPAAGCTYSFNTVACDDDSACTELDACAQGSCVGAVINVDDGNVCSSDDCDPATGPVYTANSLPCDDTNPCTLADTCVEFQCEPGNLPLDCDDGNLCTDHVCVQFEGCQQLPNSAPCDDGSVCSTIDTCAETTCQGFDLVDCDDGNACTLDLCHPIDGCGTTLIISNACRPQIVIDSPLRGATITGPFGPPSVVVTGGVSSGAGDIVSLTINGAPVSLTPGTGSFAHQVPVAVGGNILVIEAEDALGTVRKRVQSFLWSTGYRLPDPTVAKTGMVDPGLGVWLSAAVFTQLSSTLQGLFDGIDLAGAIPSPAANVSTHKVYIKNFSNNDPTLSMVPRPGGLDLTIVVANVHADIDADGKSFCLIPNPFGGCATTSSYPDIGGDLTVNAIVVTAQVDLTVENNQLKATSKNVQADVQGANVTLDNSILDFLLGDLLNTVVDGFESDIEDDVASAVEDELGPALEGALGSLAFNSTFDLPAIGPEQDDITVDLETDFSSVVFDAGGGEIYLRARAVAPHVTPYTNAGIPNRAGCAAPPQTLVITRVTPLELSLSDDLMNQMLHAAWRGGLLEFPVPDDLVGGESLEALGVTDLTMVVSGMLAPTLSDCGEGEPQVHIGDLRIDASLSLFGQPMDVVVWVSMVADFEFTAVDGDLALGLTAVDVVETEVNIVQDEMVASEGAITALIAQSLVPGLLGSLGSLGAVPLPDLDLGGGQSISIAPDEVVRVQGNTIVQGELQ